VTALVFVWGRAVRDSTLPATTRHVALTLATYADADGGSCRPGADRLARACGRHRTTVLGELCRLVAGGWLEVVEQGGAPRGGPRRASEYRLSMPTDQSPTATGQDADQSPETTGSERRPVARAAPTGSERRPHQHKTNPRSRATRSNDPDTLSAEFDRVWPSYPRRVNKAGARRAFLARRREGVALDDLKRSTRNYAARVGASDPRFILHGSTFYGPDHRYTDYLDEPAVAADPSAPSGWREMTPTW
jgi:hypothetical protein